MYRRRASTSGKERWDNRAREKNTKPDDLIRQRRIRQACLTRGAIRPPRCFTAVAEQPFRFSQRSVKRRCCLSSATSNKIKVPRGRIFGATVFLGCYTATAPSPRPRATSTKTATRQLTASSSAIVNRLKQKKLRYQRKQAITPCMSRRLCCVICTSRVGGSRHISVAYTITPPPPPHHSIAMLPVAASRLKKRVPHLARGRLVPRTPVKSRPHQQF